MNTLLVKQPIYQQLYEALRAIIHSEEFSAGEKFLTEREVSARFEVSRTTANKALSSLVSEGLLEFRKGVGTFVRENILEYDLKYLVSFTQKAQLAGLKPTTKVLEFSKPLVKDIPNRIRDALEVQTEGSLYYMERVRLASGIPVIYERRYVVRNLCPDLKKRDLRNSLYAIWTEKYDMKIIGADETISALNMSAKQATCLGVKKGTAGLVVRATGFIIKNRPFWWEETIYRADAYEFHNHLGGVRSARPAVGQLS